MAQSAESVAHEARALGVALKELLNTKDPWDAEVKFQREKLRRVHLTLLLTYPYEREGQIETHLWMQTTYNLIAKYKQLIADIDRQLEGQRPAKNTRDGQGVVAKRKIIQRFRQFLADEEKFYLQLVARCRRMFNLSEVHQVLVTLGVIPNVGPGDDASESLANAHNHSRFPPEDKTQPPQNPQQYDDCIALVGKLLIYLGDIARHRERYNESGGRPQAGQDDGPPTTGGRNKRGGADIAKARDYGRAQRFYEQARSLVPTDGHAFHQMAIIASYQRDTFGSLVYYYRAICTTTAYDPASDNLRSILERIATDWKKGGEKPEPHLNSPEVPPRIKVHIFHTHLTSLHALWKLGPEQTDETSPNLADHVTIMFASLISQRLLSIELIYRTIVLAQGALYKHKMVRERNRSRTDRLSAQDSALIEGRMLAHVVAFHSVLLKEGISQLAEASPVHAPVDTLILAQKITANFRRILPALRVASKWLRANFRYTTNRKEVFLTEFWELFARFARSLAKEFPSSLLPNLDTRLEEDVELFGFAPLRNFLSVDKGTTPLELGHPNEEQLIRIADLLNDAETLAQEPNSPFGIYGGYVAVKSTSIGSPPSRRDPRPPSTLQPTSSSMDQDISDSASDIESKMERMVHDLELSDDDQIVYPKPKAHAEPVSSASAPQTRFSPQRRVSGSTTFHSPTTPPSQAQGVKAQTASDILNSLMVNGSPHSPVYHPHLLSSPLGHVSTQPLSDFPSHSGQVALPHPPQLSPSSQIFQPAWTATGPSRDSGYVPPYPPVSIPSQQLFASHRPSSSSGLISQGPPYGAANPLNMQSYGPYRPAPIAPPQRQQAPSQWS